MHSFVRSRRIALAAVAVAGMITGCRRDDARVKAVENGITRDSLLTVIGKNAPGVDSLPNVYIRERYLIDEKYYDIMFFSPTGKHAYIGVQKDTIPWKELTPIAMIDNRVTGKGWDYLDSLYTSHNIPVKKR